MGLDIREVEDRILRACRTIRALPDKERRFFALQNSWPITLQELEEAYGYNEVVMPRFRPSPADVSDCLVALAWARGMARRVFKLVWWRSFGVDTPSGFKGMSFRQMAARLGRSDETVRRWYKDAVIELWCNANFPWEATMGEFSSRRRVASVADVAHSPIRSERSAR